MSKSKKRLANHARRVTYLERVEAAVALIESVKLDIIDNDDDMEDYATEYAALTSDTLDVMRNLRGALDASIRIA